MTDAGQVAEVDACYKRTPYDCITGKDIIHAGCFPHPNGESLALGALEDPQVSANMLTKRMIDLAQIGAESTVLVLGCGKGQPLCLIAQETRAACTGLDLCIANLVQARANATANPQLQLNLVGQDLNNEFPDNTVSPVQGMSHQCLHHQSQHHCHVATS